MPKSFQSKSQLRTCYAKKYQAESKGKQFNWNCDEWLDNTNEPQKLPEHKGGRAKEEQLSEEEGKCWRNEKICVGPKGGKYIVKGGVKIYLPSSKK